MFACDWHVFMWGAPLQTWFLFCGIMGFFIALFSNQSSILPFCSIATAYCFLEISLLMSVELGILWCDNNKARLWLLFDWRTWSSAASVKEHVRWMGSLFRSATYIKKWEKWPAITGLEQTKSYRHMFSVIQERNLWLDGLQNGCLAFCRSVFSFWVGASFRSWSPDMSTLHIIYKFHYYSCLSLPTT